MENLSPLNSALLKQVSDMRSVNLTRDEVENMIFYLTQKISRSSSHPERDRMIARLSYFAALEVTWRVEEA